MNRDRISAELEHIRSMDPDGLLRPEDVVSFAADSGTELHSQFNWDDTDAARKYRILQARDVIRASVTVVREDRPPIRTYVSLPTEREAGGGYLPTIEVLSGPRRDELLRQVRSELNRLTTQYRELDELASMLRDAASELAATT